MLIRIHHALSVLIFAAALGQAQQAATRGTQAPAHDMSQMPAHDATSMPSMNAESAHVMHSMEGHHINMGPHMKMTTPRDPKPGDEQRAQAVVEAARRVMNKYRDYNTALSDGYRIFLPNVPQKMYHFTNYAYAFEAASSFNPEHPTSLLYEKHGDDYKLVGVMYTAPKRLTEDDLDQRIPLSIAQWHEHVNFCKAPAGRKSEYFGTNAKFGILGSITTKEECDANGGEFHPIVFNWMVHVYPLEKTESAIWAVERGQAHGHMD